MKVYGLAPDCNAPPSIPKVKGATPAVVVTVTVPLFTVGHDVAVAVPVPLAPLPTETTTLSRFVVQPLLWSRTNMV